MTAAAGVTTPSVLTAAAWLLAVYGGYFGAGHGVMLIALLGLGIDEDLRVVNALKNAAVTTANAAAALVFAAVIYRRAGTVGEGTPRAGRGQGRRGGLGHSQLPSRRTAGKPFPLEAVLFRECCRARCSGRHRQPCERAFLGGAAARSDFIALAKASHAPAEVLGALGDLPDRRYATCTGLGPCKR